MSTTAPNGDHDASTTSTSTTREDDHQQSRGSARSPPTDALDAAEAHQSFTDPSAILPADLALALSFDPQQASSRQPQEGQGEHQHTLSEAQDQASYYWDASTMAPLNAVSAVSTVEAYY